MFRKTTKSIVHFTKVTKKSNGIALIETRSYSAAAISKKTQDYINKDQKFVCPYYTPVPVVCERGERIYLWDVDGRKYFDMLAGFASVSQGHCHPKIAEAMYKQSLKLTMCTRSLLSAQLADTSEFLCDMLGFDKFLSANSGVEAGEASVKLARKWAYTRKGVPANQASIVMANNNFWGRSITASGACSDPTRGDNFGPHTPGFHLVPFNDTFSLEAQLNRDPNIAAVFLETIQGEAGTIVPDDGYIKKVHDLTRKYNCLLVLDEVQAGLGRTGYLNAFEHDLAAHGLKPDIMAVGKSLSGGMTPSSGIFADNEIMNVFEIGNHGSTYGGNPLSMAVVKAAMEVTRDEGLVQNSAERGEQMRRGFGNIKSTLLKDVRGRGLMTAIEVDRDSYVNGDDLCDIFRHHGLLTKSTKEYSIRFTPALVINANEVDQVCQIVSRSFEDLEELNEQRANQQNVHQSQEIKEYNNRQKAIQNL